MAAPFVAGVAALLLSEYPDMSPLQLKNTIMNHAEIVYDDDGNSVFEDLCVSGGRLNAQNVFSHFCRTTETSSLYVHTCFCRTCGFTFEEEHDWIDMIEYFECGLCGKQSVSIPVLPIDATNSISIYGNLLNLEDGEKMAINADTIICYINGQYFLVKSKTETKV